jgi:hypothetical protein
MISFQLDANGILKVTAEEEKTKKKADVVIQNSRGRVSSQEVEEMVKRAQDFEALDKIRLENIKAKQDLEGMLYANKACLDESEAQKNLTPEERKEAHEILDSGIDWVDHHPEGLAFTYKEKMKEYEDKMYRFMTKIYSAGSGGGDLGKNVQVEPATEEYKKQLEERIRRKREEEKRQEEEKKHQETKSSSSVHVDPTYSEFKFSEGKSVDDLK